MTTAHLSYVKKWLLWSTVSVLLLVGLFAAGTAQAASCTHTYTAGAAAPQGYAPAWNTLTSAKELLVEGIDCAASTTIVRIGSGAANQYAYARAYHWTGGAWAQVPLAGQGQAEDTSWYAGSASGSFTHGTGTQYVVGYVCQYDTGDWRCGCTDASCTTSAWQLQAMTEYTGPAGAVLEEPPVLTNPLIVENVCPEDANWPTYNQMAGRDVKITLPKDRACTKEAHLGGTSDNPAQNIWVSGGEIDYRSTAIQNGGGVTLIEWTGTAFFEGLNIDINNSCADGIRSYNPREGRVVIQNSWIHGMAYCYPEGTHGDFYHAQGSNNRTGTNIRELVIQNVRADLIRQGLFVPWRSNGHGVRKMSLDHVELRLDPEYKDPRDSIATMIFAWSSNANGDTPPPDGQSYREVYLNWWDPHYPDTIGRTNITKPTPTGYDAKDCAVFSSTDITTGNIDGAWCKGSPSGGTFVPLDKVGRNYNRSYFTSSQ